MFIDKLNLKPDEIPKKEQEFYSVLGSLGQDEMVYKELYLFFDNLTVDARKKYEKTYWRWFTQITWYRLTSIKEEEFIKLVDHQLLTAIFLGIDVWKEIMNYFVLNTRTESQVKSLYNKLKEKVINSDVAIGAEKEKIITLSEIASRVKKLRLPATTSIDSAQILSSIKNVIFDKNSTKDFKIRDDEVLENLVSFLDFLFTVKIDEIWKFLNVYIEDVFYSDSMEKLKEFKSEKKKTFILLEIKKEVEKNVEKNKKGEFDNVENVFKELDRLANENGDDRIRELYYFNEKTGKFEWNEELLKGV